MKTKRYSVRRRGAVIILIAVLMVTLISLVALAVDMGYLFVIRAGLQATADSASLAGASGLVISDQEAILRATDYAYKNIVNGAPVVLQPGDIELGTWDAAAHVFTPLGSSSPTKPFAVKVSAHLSQARGTAVDLFFAKVFGKNTADVGATAVAVFGLRDIMVVLDYSGSMNDDSMLGESHLSLSKVLQNLQQIYQDLGSPAYGTMQYNPVTIPSTNSNATILSMLGLTGVPYPYPQGSWNSYVQYVKTDSSVQQAGYRNRYGYLTLMNYWLSLSPKQPDPNHLWNLWQAHEQPITAVKDALTIFLNYMRQVETDDRVGLVAYTYTDGSGYLEVPLTLNFSLIESTSRQRQAGHYFDYTNIGAGLQTARTELLSHGRNGTLRMIVLLSDGNTNWLNNRYDLSGAKRAALDQARAANQDGFPVLTISLGANADHDLMQQIADLTGGVHFFVPGGDDVADYESQLMSVFAQIAAARPQRLVD